MKASAPSAAATKTTSSQETRAMSVGLFMGDSHAGTLAA